MNRKLIVITGLLVLTLAGAAQNKPVKFKFSSVNSVALAVGEQSTDGVLQTVNGLQKGKWFAGIGMGLDYYLYRTAPVFVDVRREFGEKKNKPFVYADAGWNIAWVQKYFNIMPSIWNGNQENTFHNGFYSDVGVGVALGVKHEQAFIMSLGYSFKGMRETRTYTWGLPELEQKEEFKYNFNRIMIKLGWKF